MGYPGLLVRFGQNPANLLSVSPSALLPARQISDAKDHLSDVVNDAVRKHQPQLIERRGESEVLVIGLEEQLRVLRPFVFEPRVTFGREVVMSLERHGLVVSGSSLDAAADAMVEALLDYSRDFLERYDFFRYTPHKNELPWILRFALTPPAEQRTLLFEEPIAEESAIVGR
jgi:prevent-host-death family protein